MKNISESATKTLISENIIVCLFYFCMKVIYAILNSFINEKKNFILPSCIVLTEVRCKL